MISIIGKRLGESLGQAIAAGLMQGVQGAGDLTNGALKRRGSGRPPKAESAAALGKPVCIVPDCGRQGVAKGLCATHYRKARRLKFGDTLSSAQLSELAEDGRKARFSKKGEKS
jgi:hypothetical protein